MIKRLLCWLPTYLPTYLSQVEKVPTSRGETGDSISNCTTIQTIYFSSERSIREIPFERRGRQLLGVSTSVAHRTYLAPEDVKSLHPCLQLDFVAQWQAATESGPNHLTRAQTAVLPARKTHSTRYPVSGLLKSECLLRGFSTTKGLPPGAGMTLAQLRQDGGSRRSGRSSLHTVPSPIRASRAEYCLSLYPLSSDISQT
ncbi:hypothetical protein EV126DRAFT_248431 [Verticillium dahliae]|nr:hypothetical protein EV126DRAFT_248431 [Verticillium dahliae]